MISSQRWGSMGWCRSIMHRWRTFRHLSRAEQWLLLQTGFLLPLIALALRVFGFRRLHGALARLLPMPGATSRSAEQALTQAYATAQVVQAAVRQSPYPVNCLQQSLVLWWLLRRRRLSSDLRLGVRKATSRFEAHAWVEYRGFVLNDSEDVHQRFAPFDQSIAPVEVTL